MIKIELTNGDVLRLNLKNRAREKSLRDAWYAMSDMVSKQSKVLKIVSYTGNKYNLKVSEVKSCMYDDSVFDYSTSEVQKFVPPIRKVFENSVTPKEPVSVLDSIQSIMDATEEIFKSIPEKYKANLFTFRNALKEADVPLMITDLESMQISLEAVGEEDPAKMGEHVQRFIDHWKSKGDKNFLV